MKNQEVKEKVQVNFCVIDKGSPFFKYFAYIDRKDHAADDIFIKHKLRVHFLKDFRKDGSNFEIIYCKVNKKRKNDFIVCMFELDQKLLLSDGYKEYMETKEKIGEFVEKNGGKNVKLPDSLYAVEKKSLFFKYYTFIDRIENDDILVAEFVAKNIADVTPITRYKMDNSNYEIIFCKVPKWQEKRFVKAIYELEEKVKTLKDYKDFVKAKEFMKKTCENKQ